MEPFQKGKRSSTVTFQVHNRRQGHRVYSGGVICCFFFLKSQIWFLMFLELLYLLLIYHRFGFRQDLNLTPSQRDAIPRYLIPNPTCAIEDNTSDWELIFYMKCFHFFLDMENEVIVCFHHCFILHVVIWTASIIPYRKYKKFSLTKLDIRLA